MRPYWHYQDPREADLGAAVSGDLLMRHVATIGAWERESGSPGEAQAFDYAPVVPLAPARSARALLATLEELQAAARGRVDLGPAADAARRLVSRAEALQAALDRQAGGASRPGAVEAANRTLLRLSQILVPLAYTSGDRFRHDLALPLPPLAGLQAARDLGSGDPAAEAFRFAAAALVRERNRTVHTLEEATDVIDDLFDRKEISP